MLRLQLQRFAEKTERATPQRRREARQEGRLPKSSELTSAVALLGVLLAIRMWGPQVWGMWEDTMRTGLSGAVGIPMTQTALPGLFDKYTWLLVKMLTPMLGVALVVGPLVAFAQVGPMFLPNLLTPDLKRIDPIAGLRRVWSLRSLMELVKSLLKLSIVGSVAYFATKGVQNQLQGLMTTAVVALPGIVGGMVFRLTIEVAVLMLLLAFLDFLFQRFEFERSIRMSRDEIKEEMKRQEGDPLIRSKIRQRGRALAMRRMMQDVPKADVIITNPTHFSVALQYDSTKMAAPVVLAKGADEIAWRIRQLADQAGIPRVENRPLAQALYRQVGVGEPIPQDLFQAVAEVLAYVYRLKAPVQ